MFSPLLNIVMEYVGSTLVGILAALIFKAWFVGQMKNKIRGYQSDIVKSHSKILELEAKNERLEKRIKEMEGSFIRDRILMN